MSAQKKSKVVSSQHFTCNKRTIALIDWLIEHDQESLKKLLIRAYQHDRQRVVRDDFLDEEDAQYIFFKLVGLIEILCDEIVQEQEVSHLCNYSLLPEMKRIDSKAFEKTLIEHSANKALSHAKEKKTTPSSLLFEELLKKWKPQKKDLQ